MKRSRNQTLLSLFLLLVLSVVSTGTSFAQKKDVKKATKKKKKKSKWKPSLTLGADFSLAQSSSVPGIEDGITFGIGAIIKGGIQFKHKQHFWETTLKIVHRQTKTPMVPLFVKTADELDFQSTYKYSFKKAKKAALLVSFQLTSPVLFGWLVVSEDKDLILNELDGSQKTAKSLKNDPFELTSFFSPLILRQKLGFSVQPSKDKVAALDIQLTATAQETIASGYAVNDDATTPEVELKALQNVNQVGIQARMDLKGSFKKKFSYEFYADIFYPLYSDVPTTLEGFDLLNVDFSLKLSVKLLKWASLDYVFRAQKLPLVSENWQVLNTLLFSVKTNIF